MRGQIVGDRLADNLLIDAARTAPRKLEARRQPRHAHEAVVPGDSERTPCREVGVLPGSSSIATIATGCPVTGHRRPGQRQIPALGKAEERGVERQTPAQGARRRTPTPTARDEEVKGRRPGLAQGSRLEASSTAMIENG